MQTGPLLSMLFRLKKWDKIVENLEPAFDLLNKAGRDLKGKQIERAYDKLDLYQKKMLNDMVTWAFLRKTSKFGMTFARDQGMPVLFAWKTPNTADDLEEMRELLEVKPYKYQMVVARELGYSGRITLEVITLSEMRELGRLQQKMMAPDYLLIIGVNEDAGDQKISSSTGAASFGNGAASATPAGFGVGARTTGVAGSGDSDDWTVATEKNKKYYFPKSLIFSFSL